MKIAVISTINPKDDIRIYQKFVETYQEFRDVDYYCTDFVQSDKNDLNQNVNFKIHKSPYGLKERFKLIRNFKKIFKNQEYEYIQIENLELLLAVPYLKKQGKVVFDMHEDFESTILDKNSLSKIIRRPLSFLYRKYINYLINNKSLSKVFVTTPLIKEKFPQENVYIIENYAPLMDGAHNKLSEPILLHEIKSNANFKLIFTGLMTEQRGILEVIQSLVQFDDVDLYLLGIISNDFKEKVINEIDSLNLDKRVHLIDSLPYSDMIELMKLMDAGVIPYLTYKNHVVTRPNKLFEYMASKLPVLCSNFPLYEEVVNQGCGLTFTPENVESISSSIKELRSMDFVKMGNKGYQLYLGKYNWEVEAKRLQEILKI